MRSGKGVQGIWDRRPNFGLKRLYGFLDLVGKGEVRRLFFGESIPFHAIPNGDTANSQDISGLGFVALCWARASMSCFFLSSCSSD